MSNPTAESIEELAALLQDFLPGPGPGYPVTKASFQGIARDLEIQQFWQGHMKIQSIRALLEGTLAKSPEKFPQLILQIIEQARLLRSGKNAFNKRDLDLILACLKNLNVSITELESDDFLSELPSGENTARPTQALQKMPMSDLNSRMRKDLITLTMMPEEERGLALEQFINRLFANSDLRPLAPFRFHDAAVTGKLKVGPQVCALHAGFNISTEKLQKISSSQAAETRCIVIGLPGFVDDAKEFLGSSECTNLLAVDLRDIFLVLDGGANLEQMIGLKMRAAEKGKCFVFVQDLLIG